MSKLYTVAEANRTLPYVGAVVTEIRERYRAIQDQGSRLRRLPRSDAAGQADLRGEIKEHARRIEACMEELKTLGVDLKDHAEGLVDFPAELEGRPIHLCWKQGEEAVSHWHEIHAGFAGRRPVPADLPAWPGKKSASQASSPGR